MHSMFVALFNVDDGNHSTSLCSYMMYGLRKQRGPLPFITAAGKYAFSDADYTGFTALKQVCS
jgi:hypothetical protein